MTVVDDVRAQVDDLEQKLREFFAAAEETLAAAASAPVPVGGPVLLSPELMDAVRDGLRRVRAEMQSVLDRFGQFLDQPGDPERLRQAAAGWSVVADALSDAGGKLGLDQMRTNIEWEGGGAEAYKAMVPRQGEQLSTMTAQSQALSTSLHGLADQIESFWLALGAAAALMVIAVVTAIVGAATVVGIPAACGAILVAVGGAATLILTAVQQMNTLTDRIATEQRAMGQALRDIGTAWPMPNAAAMADASVTDGDAAEWRPNR
ncbi:hypothetical protein [Actinomycetospora sp. NBRC 106375]|uniref:hypothetical protein n=1 Tax=Actinomycetospora sp. NBRC 106375 TaxID=3032207 RepID=UPI002554C277|nr:hypothetical protein [Actinomycetospora sp. NBRC 106375]